MFLDTLKEQKVSSLEVRNCKDDNYRKLTEMLTRFIMRAVVSTRCAAVMYYATFSGHLRY